MKPTGKHVVIVAAEENFNGGAAWVARDDNRDDNGDWRSYARISEHWPTAATAAAAMFHGDEVIKIHSDSDDRATVVLHTY